MEGDDDKTKEGYLVTDMLNAGVVKPSEKLKTSIGKNAGNLSDTDRNRIAEMLKGLGKYRDMEDIESLDDKHLQPNKSERSSKSPGKIDTSPKPGFKGLLDFIDAEMTPKDKTSSTHSEISPKKVKDIVIKPAATLNNKTNLKALSSAFQKLHVESPVGPSLEDRGIESGDSPQDGDIGSGKKRRRRKRNRGKKQEQDEECEQVSPNKDLQPILVYDTYEDDAEINQVLKEHPYVVTKGAAKGSYSQLLQTMGKGPAKEKSPVTKAKSPQGKIREYKGAEMIHIAAACDLEGKTKRDVIIEQQPGKKQKQKGKKGKEHDFEENMAQTSNKPSVADRLEAQAGKGKPKKGKGGGPSPKQPDSRVQSPKQLDARGHQSPKQAHREAVGKRKEAKNAEARSAEQFNQQNYNEMEQVLPVEPDYATTATVNVHKQEHKFVIGPQRKHLQEIHMITGVQIDVPPANNSSEAIILTGPKSQLGPAIALMLSKCQQAQIEASLGKSPSARNRDILLSQGKYQQGYQGPQAYQGYHVQQGYQGYQSQHGYQDQQGYQDHQGYQGQPSFQGQQSYQGQQGNHGHQNKKGQSGNQKERARLQTPPLLGRQHSSNSQSSLSEHDLDVQEVKEVKGRNVNQNANRSQRGQRGQGGQRDIPDGNRGQGRRPYGNLVQIDLKGPSLYDQHHRDPNRQQQNRGHHGGRQQDYDPGQQGRRGYNEEQVAQGGPHRGQGKRQRIKKAVFTEYITPEELSAGLKRGHLIQGPIRINPKNYEESYVPHPDGLSDIIICGMKDRNRALNGDIVAVEIAEKGDWKLNKEELEHVVEAHKADTSAGNNEDDSDESDADIVIESEETIELVVNKSTDNQSSADKSLNDSVQDSGNKSKKHRESPMKRFVCLKDVMTTGSKSAKKLFGADGSVSAKKMLIRTGVVVAIVEKKHSRAASGHIKPFQDKCPDKAMFCPNDHRVPRITIPLKECPEKFTERPEDFSNTLFVARIIEWRKDAPYADGHLAKSLGEAGEIDPETDGMLIENGIDFDEFPQEVLDCLPKQSPWSIPESEFEYRRDFRSSCVFTIDPTTARDLDDALSCEELGNGRYKVGVHIADVSYFVKENTSLDVMAGLRATSVYLVQKVVPMLPRLLCEQLCSLNPDVERLTFSVEWIISEQGEIEEEWFGRSVIKSCVKLAYDHAQGFIEQPDKVWTREELPPISQPYSVDDIKSRVLNLHKIAQNMRKARLDSGSLRLDQVKLQYSLDKETMMPNGYYVYEQRESNRLVEEFMLLANMAVAHKINAAYPDHALLRRHPEPQQKMLDFLKDTCSALGIHLDVTSAGSLQRSLRNYCGDDEYSRARMQVLVVLCAKPMQNAKYFCTGCIEDEHLYHHYALNVPLYTHFTSPIRRYPDIIVHRLLGASLGYCDPPSQPPTQIHRTAEHCNDKKTAAKRVGDLSGELFFAVFVKTVGPLEEKGMVMAVFDKSFDVFIVKLGVSKRVYCDKLSLKEKVFKKERKVPSLKLIWKAEEGVPEIQQDLSIFSVVDCVLQQGELPLQWVVTIKRPNLSVLQLEHSS